MRATWRMGAPTAWVLCFGLTWVAFLSGVAAEGKSVPGILNERGFRAVYYDGCGFGWAGGSSPFAGADRGSIFDAACPPGGPWGSDLYLAVEHPYDDSGSYIETVSASGEIGGFAGCCSGREFPRTLSFAPLGWRGGDILFAGILVGTTFHPHQVLLGYTPSGSDAGGFFCPHDPYGAPSGSIGPAAVDPSGAFGDDLFMNRFCGSEAGVYRVNAAGSMSLFSTAGSAERFGPGGPWGTGLYGAGVVLAPDGSTTSVPGWSGEEFDWAFGDAFGGDMFFLCGSGQICRLKPGGAMSLFATIPSAGGAIAYCNGSLWIAGDGCYKITPKK